MLRDASAMEVFRFKVLGLGLNQSLKKTKQKTCFLQLCTKFQLKIVEIHGAGYFEIPFVVLWQVIHSHNIQ